MKLYAQGDCLFFMEPIPKDKMDLLKTNIIEHGEATGHAHRLDIDEFEHLQNPKTKERYLRIAKPTKVKHEEHGAITLPPGEYRIGRVREKGMFDDLIAPVVD